MASDKENAWERVQIKGLTAWANTYLDQGNHISSLENDLIDGVKLCLLTEGLKNRIEELQRKKIGNWTRKPAHRMQKIENANVSLNFLKNDMKVKHTTGAEDIVGDQETNVSNLKMVLGLFWTTFRKTMGIAEGTSTSEEYAALLEWVREVTAGYKGVQIKGMKDSWADGLALSALLHKAGVKIDYNNLDPSLGGANLMQAFRLAEETFKIPQLLEIDELMKCNPDERSVAFYLNLLKHAMQEYFEKNKIKMGVQALQDELEALRRKLEEEARRRAALEEELQRLRQMNEDTLTKLRAEEQLRTEDKTAFEDQLHKLQMLLTDEQEDSRRAEDELRRLKSQLEEALRAKSELEELRRKLEGEGGNLAGQLAAELERRQKLEAELEELRRQLAAETERRKNRSRAAEELEAENTTLKRQALLQHKMRAGMEVLKANLMAHLEDVYQYRDLQHEEADKRDVFDLQQVLGQLHGKAAEQQLQLLSDKLANENINLQRLIHIRDAKAELNDVVDKSGFMNIKGASKHMTAFTKQWFVLQGDKLLYFKSDTSDRPNGTIPLLKAEVHTGKKEDGHEFQISIKLEDKVIQLSAKDRKERDVWRVLLGGAVTRLQYLEAVRKAGSSRRPDSRVVALCRQESVKGVWFDHAPLQTEEVVAIAGALRSMLPTLDTVSFENAGLNDDKLKLLGKVLSAVQFKALRLPGNKDVSGQGIIALNEALSKNAAELRELKLNDCKIDDSVVSVLGPLVEASPKLVALDLSHNVLSDGGVSSLVNAFQKAASLTNIELSHNKIGATGAKALASLIKNAAHVRALRLAGNNIGDDGAKALASAAAASGGLSELDLTNTGLSSAGVAALLDAVKSSQSLNKLQLSENKVASGSELAAFAAGGLNFGALQFVRAQPV